MAHILSSLTLIISIAATSCGRTNSNPSMIRSLTGDDFKGQKYYLGWGSVFSPDPELMHNEVKFDVLHTHDIFSRDLGGSYTSSTEIGPQVNATTIRNHWSRISEGMTSEDMFVQYSSGHGMQTGLGIGVSYNEMRDAVLAMPVKEAIVFTMACYSGNLVAAFDKVRDRWSDWEAQGRTLFVMSSSTTRQTSSTGPGQDPDQPGSPNGSAGSAFGHSLWKALIGYADGWIDGVKDGYLTLDEITQFVKWKTRLVGRHDPMITGTWNPGLIINRVPPKSFIESLEHSTENLSDEQIMELAGRLNESMRVQ